MSNTNKQTNNNKKTSQKLKNVAKNPIKFQTTLRHCQKDGNMAIFTARSMSSGIAGQTFYKMLYKILCYFNS